MSSDRSVGPLEAPHAGLAHDLRVVVVSHKECWTADGAVMSSGGFPAQMDAVADLAEIHLVVPVVSGSGRVGTAMRVSEISPLTPLMGQGSRRRLRTVLWLCRVVPVIVRAVMSADVVYCLVPGDVGAVGMVLAALLRRPLVIRHCGTWNRRDTPAERLTMILLERLSKRHVVLATGWAEVPPSIHAPSVAWIFSASLRRSDMERLGRERLAPSPPRARLVTAGRQVSQKGTECVLRSLRLLVDEGRDISLDVIGDGPELGRFEQIAQTAGVAHRVQFHGRLPHAQAVRVMDAADLFVFPTTSNEGFPKVVAEAMACGLPIVSTPVSALATIVPGAGMLIPAPVPDALADAVGGLLDDAERYRLASGAARERAAGFTIEGWQKLFASRILDRYPSLSE